MNVYPELAENVAGDARGPTKRLDVDAPEIAPPRATADRLRRAVRRVEYELNEWIKWRAVRRFANESDY